MDFSLSLLITLPCGRSVDSQWALAQSPKLKLEANTTWTYLNDKVHPDASRDDYEMRMQRPMSLRFREPRRPVQTDHRYS